MIYVDCRMLQGSGISTYLMGLISQYQANYSHYKLNYLVREYTRVISTAPDYLLQHSYQFLIPDVHMLMVDSLFIFLIFELKDLLLQQFYHLLVY